MAYWQRDEYTTNYTCPYCGMMVRDNGYGSCDYEFCPYCSEAVQPMIAVTAIDVKENKE